MSSFHPSGLTYDISFGAIIGLFVLKHLRKQVCLCVVKISRKKKTELGYLYVLLLLLTTVTLTTFFSTVIRGPSKVVRFKFTESPLKDKNLTQLIMWYFRSISSVLGAGITLRRYETQQNIVNIVFKVFN